MALAYNSVMMDTDMRRRPPGPQRYKYAPKQIHFILKPSEIKAYDDLHFEKLPGWVTTHTMADRGWWLDVRQKVLASTGRGKIRAIFSPDLHRTTGIRVVFRHQELLADGPDGYQRFFNLLRFTPAEGDYRFDLKFNPPKTAAFLTQAYGEETLDAILDNYPLMELIKRDTKRRLEALRASDGPISPEVQEAAVASKMVA